jgi:SWI/SNF-related matrix-associated actin-dependent regulator 1 of chromatin subfamily A
MALAPASNLSRALSKGFSLKVQSTPGLSQSDIDECLENFYLACLPRSIAANLIMPDDLVLFPFQETGIHQMLGMFQENKNVLLGDEMGLGKTIQALVTINSMVPSPESVLIIAPRSLVYNWRNEAHNILVDRKIDDLFCIGTPAFIDITQNFLICSYEVFAATWPILAHKQWDIIILDEFHMVKNTGTKRYKGAKEFIKTQKTAHVMGMTGTPIVNYPIELWPLLNMLDPTKWNSLARFESEYTFGGTKRAYVRNAGRLQKILRESILIRRMKREVMPELPPKRRKIIELEVTDKKTIDLIEEEMSLFKKGSQKPLDALTDFIMEMNSAGGIENETDWMTLIDGLKHNKKYFFEQMARLRHEIALAKLPQTKEHLTNVIESQEDGDKFLIFAHHKDVIADLQKFINDTYYMLGKGKNRCVVMTGAQSIAERQFIQDDFQSTNNVFCIIGNMEVMGKGWTLTKADHAIFVEGSWVPGTLTQAEDRLHRISQTEKILIEHLVMTNSLDAYMAKKVVAKQRQIDRTINRM